MRLLIVTPEFAPHAGGGILRYYGDLAPALARAGADVTILVSAPFSADFDAYEIAAGCRVACVRSDSIRTLDLALPQFSAAPEFRRWLAAGWAARQAAVDQGPFDVIETTDFGLGFVPFLSQPVGSPVVVRCHGSLGQISEHEPHSPSVALDLALARLTEVTALPLADVMETYAVGNAREWSARLGREVGVLRPALDVRGGDRAREPYALAVGRIQSWKGPDVLCRALRSMPAQDCPKVLWVGRDTKSGAGGTSLDAELRRRYPDVWGSRVEPVGPRPLSEVITLMARAQFVVVPSLWDVFNFTAAEAMAAANVVVCSDGAGAHELIASGENGIVCGAGNATSLAEGMTTAAALSEVQAARIGSAARETIRVALDPDAVARRHLETYQGLCAKSAPCPEWLASFYAPSSSARVGFEYLEQVGIRDLGSYVAGRLRRRWTRGGTAES